MQNLTSDARSYNITGPFAYRSTTSIRSLLAGVLDLPINGSAPSLSFGLAGLTASIISSRLCKCTDSAHGADVTIPERDT